MNKETSSRVSSIAAAIMGRHPMPEGDNETIATHSYNVLLADAKTLAGSCMSQDETPGQDKTVLDFRDRLKIEREDLDERLTKLTQFLGKGASGATPRHKEMLGKQLIAMSEYLAILDERLADLSISDRSAPVEEIEDHEDGDDGA